MEGHAGLLVEAALIGVHILGGGVWVGAMVFSIFVLHPRAETYFEKDSDFEDFIFTVVHGARWKVFSGIVAILASGIGLSFWPGHELVPEGHWIAAYVGKIVLFALSAGCFVYVSWVLWPRRSFATAEELPPLKRHFMRVGVVMVVANSLNMALGIAAHVSRGV
jgi:hypothetical protein